MVSEIKSVNPEESKPRTNIVERAEQLLKKIKTSLSRGEISKEKADYIASQAMSEVKASLEDGDNKQSEVLAREMFESNGVQSSATALRHAKELSTKLGSGWDALTNYALANQEKAADAFEYFVEASNEYGPELVKQAIELGIPDEELYEWFEFQKRQNEMPKRLDLMFHCQRMNHLSVLLDTVNQRGTDHLRLFSKEESNLLGIGTEAMSPSGKSEAGEVGENFVSLFLNQPITSYGQIIWVIPPKNVLKPDCRIRYFDNSYRDGLARKGGEISMQTQTAQQLGSGDIDYGVAHENFVEQGGTVDSLGVDLNSPDALCLIPEQVFDEVMQLIDGLSNLGPTELSKLKRKFVSYQSEGADSRPLETIANWKNNPESYRELVNSRNLDDDQQDENGVVEGFWQSQGLMEHEILGGYDLGWLSVREIPEVGKHDNHKPEKLMLFKGALEALGFNLDISGLPPELASFVMRDAMNLVYQSQNQEIGEDQKKNLIQSFFNLTQRTDIKELSNRESQVIGYLGYQDSDFLSLSSSIDFWKERYTPIQKKPT
jgi:hypothetical protein